MRYYIIAGEASGDLHGSNLIKKLLLKDSSANIRCWGGDLMREAGGELVVHYREMAFMGLIDVIRNLTTIWKRLRFCKQDLKTYMPDVVILIDYPGFNLRMARFAKQQRMKVCYYISPKVWAWKQSRVNLIRKYVDLMMVILPFEKDFYRRFGIEVEYVGNPLLEAVQQHKINPEFKQEHQIEGQRLIAVLPGSRRQEVNQMLRIMVEVADGFPEFTFIVGGLSSLPKEFYTIADDHQNIKLVFDQTYDLLAHSHAALVTSGTATLETALFEVPQVVCYQTSWFNYQIGKRLVNVPFISLVNLIAEKEVVKELIQDEFSKSGLTRELSSITSETDNRRNQLEGYKLIKDKLTALSASDVATELLLDLDK